MIEQDLETRQVRDRKESGIFYTPPELTSILCNWAVRTPNDRILEPSFGGCNFLDSIRLIFEKFGNNDYISQLGGCDTDKNAFHYLSKSLDIVVPPAQFKLSDFLHLTPADFNELFDVVIGNPPYVSSHNMDVEQIALGQDVLKQKNRSLGKRASLWGYFILHSLSFLKEGGRIAFILPSSFLHTKYASQIREYLQEGFQRSLVIQVGERVFLSEGTSEVAVVVVCEGWQKLDNKKGMEIVFAPTLDLVEPLLTGWSSGTLHGLAYVERSNLALLSPKALREYSSLIQDKHCFNFEDIAQVLIGMVTGDNKFFVINGEKAKKEDLPDEVLHFVVAKYNDFSGIQLTNHDQQMAIESGKNCLLFDTSGLSCGDHPAVSRLLENYPKEKRDNNKTFAKRKRWDQPNDNRIPDAFFTYMSHDGPAMRLNLIQVNCTNTVHRVFFGSNVNLVKQKLIAISLLTTFSQLSAEIECRSYGSGVLKHEPSEIKRIKLYIPDDLEDSFIEEKFSEIDLILRQGNKHKAQQIADNTIFSRMPKNERLIKVLQKELVTARERRIPPNKRK